MIRVIVAVLCILFGLATLKEGGGVVFDVGDARNDAGHYVFFVVLVNFLLGFFYVAAGAGFLRKRRWAIALGFAIAAISAVTFVAFAVHVALGGAFELRTVLALTLRTLFWGGVTAYMRRTSG